MIPRTIICLLSFTCFLLFSACDGISDKAGRAIHNTKQQISATKKKVIDKRKKMADQVLPVYDSWRADTEQNKKRYAQHIGLAPTSDVKDIFCHGDFMGADYKVLMAFHCDSTTFHHIIQKKRMVKAANEHDGGLLFDDPHAWWHANKIARLVPYKSGKENEFWAYLWYDTTSSTAYYEEYSL